MLQVRDSRLLDIAIYLIVAIMVAISFISIADETTRATAGSLCAAFGLVHALGFRKAGTPARLALYFAAQTLLILALLRLVAPRDVFNLLFYILAILAIMLLPTRPAIAWIAGFFTVNSLNALWNQGSAVVSGVLFYAAAFTLTAVFGYALRQAEIARRNNQELLEELKTTQHQLQDLAVVEERARMARELHDSLGHRLTVSIVQLEGAQRLIPTEPERAARMIATMREEMKQALSELRSTVYAMRAPILDDLPLEAALLTLSQTFQNNTGISTHFSASPGFPALPEPYHLAFYRAAQEGLTNIQRHALAHNAWLQLNSAEQMISLVIADDGKGMADLAEKDPGTGLLGLKERAGQLGGELRLEERPAGGTQLIISVPLPKQGVSP